MFWRSEAAKDKPNTTSDRTTVGDKDQKGPNVHMAHAWSSRGRAGESEQRGLEPWPSLGLHGLESITPERSGKSSHYMFMSSKAIMI